VNVFEQTATHLFETAQRAAEAELDATEWTLLVGPSGEVTLIADSTWALDRLATERGAGIAYRISRRGAEVRLEGRYGAQRCRIEWRKPMRLPIGASWYGYGPAI